MSDRLSPSAQKVQDALKALGFSNQVTELQSTTRTSVEAAQAVGCQVEQIAKSLVFQGKRTNRPILVIASGANRVNEKRIAEFVSEPVGKADADYVRKSTGFVIGGVPPIARTLRSWRSSSMRICSNTVKYGRLLAVRMQSSGSLPQTLSR